MNKQISLKSANTKYRIYSVMLTKVNFLIMALFFSTYSLAETGQESNSALPEITVYKSASCSCCQAWLTHLNKNGFKVLTYNMTDLSKIKTALGLKPHLTSCHTASVGGYIIEGHVPAVDIIQLLQNKPEAVGLAAAGMPKYSPGMQDPAKQARGYDVLMFDEEGNTSVFKHY